MSKLLCILGPTAVGKTRTASLAASELDGEILSADSRQVYRFMDLGTGKDYGDYMVRGKRIPAHLIDIVDPPQRFSLFDYVKAFTKAWKEVIDRGSLPILCGGSGLYLEAVIAGYPLVEAVENPELRSELSNLSMEDLHGRLISLTTPHNTTDSKDRERLVRAIEIATHTKNHPEDVLELPRFTPLIYGVAMDRSLLRKRIEKRLRKRMEAGLLEEVQSLLDHRGLTIEDLHYYGLEYRYAGDHLAGRLNKNDMFQKLRGAIFRFAKRQETWFRRMGKKGFSIRWLDGEKRPEANALEIVSHWNSTG